MNEPLFELVSDEHGAVRRPIAPDPDWTPILADAIARWAARRPRFATLLRRPGGPALAATPAEPAQ